MDIRQRHRLACDIWAAINAIAWTGSEQEPDYVAKLISILPGVIKRSLSAMMPWRQFLVGGAYIHQKPIVHFLNKSGFHNPELGDLLIVCRERRTSGYVYNAMLLQAKVTTDLLQTRIPRDHQYVLYSEWPMFEYMKAGALNGKRRSVLPKTITQGAQYLLIEKGPQHNMLTANVDIPLRGTRCFASTIASIMSFNDGRTFQVSSPRDHWSQMILDLLLIAASSVFTRKNSGFVKENRWNGSDAFNLILNTGQTENEGQEQTHNFEEIDAVVGVSVICVDLGDAED